MFSKTLMLLLFIAMAVCSKGQINKVQTISGAASTPPAGFNVTVSLLAGSETEKGEKDDSDPLKARFLGPKRLAWNPGLGALYVADGSSNSTLRRIDAAGRVSTIIPWRFLGNYDEIYALCSAPDISGGVYFTTKGNRLFKYDPRSPISLEQTGDHAINPRIIIGRYKSPDAYINKNGNELGSLAAAGLDGAQGLTATPDGKLFVANTYRKTVHKIDFAAPASDQVQELAGRPTSGVADTAFTFKDGPGMEASFGKPVDVTCDETGNVYVADGGYKTVRKITPAGVVSSFFQHTPTTGLEFRDKDGTLNGATSERVNLIAANGNGSLLFFSSFGRLRVLRPGVGITTLAAFNDINGLATTADGKTVYVSSGYAIYKVVLR